MKKVKIIGITGNKRLPQLSQYPTITESHNLTIISWSGIFAQPNLPEHISKYLNTVFANAIRDKEFQDFLTLRGATPLSKNDLKSSVVHYEGQHKFYTEFFKKNKTILQSK